MSNLTITPEALIFLARHMLSCCHPLMKLGKNKNGQNEKYIHFRAKEGKSATIKEITCGLSGQLVLFDKLQETAESLSKSEVDADVVFHYFGGKIHVDKVLDDIRQQKLGALLKADEVSKFFLHHILLPVELIEIKGVICKGKYSIKGKEVIIADLLPFKSQAAEMKVGDRVLVHFSAIISRCQERNKLIWQQLKQEQQKSKSFMDFISLLDGRELEQCVTLRSMSQIMESYDL